MLINIKTGYNIGDNVIFSKGINELSGNIIGIDIRIFKNGQVSIKYAINSSSTIYRIKAEDIIRDL